MKILLTGKDGQVGRELQRALAPLGELTALGRDKADLENPSMLAAALRAHAADIIVNAAAYTAVDRAESEEARARRVNGEAAGQIAAHAEQSGALLVHYSTDYVFDGEKDRPYVETDPTGPVSAYGRTKLAGEQAIARSGCDALVFRTSWVFAAHGDNFVKTVLRLAGERDTLNMVADQHGAPTAARLIADVTAQAIEAWQRKTLPAGIYHLAAGGATTWHEIAAHVVERARANGMALRLQARDIAPIVSEAYPTPARRPKNSRLDCGKLARALDFAFPAWQTDIDHVVDQLTRPGLAAQSAIAAAR